MPRITRHSSILKTTGWVHTCGQTIVNFLPTVLAYKTLLKHLLQREPSSLVVWWLLSLLNPHPKNGIDSQANREQEHSQHLRDFLSPRNIRASSWFSQCFPCVLPLPYADCPSYPYVTQTHMSSHGMACNSISRGNSRQWKQLGRM